MTADAVKLWGWGEGAEEVSEGGEGARGGGCLLWGGRGEKVGESVCVQGLRGHRAHEVVECGWVCDVGLSVRIRGERIGRWRG